MVWWPFDGMAGRHDPRGAVTPSRSEPCLHSSYIKPLVLPQGFCHFSRYGYNPNRLAGMVDQEPRMMFRIGDEAEASYLLHPGPQQNPDIAVWIGEVERDLHNSQLALWMGAALHRI